jgi:hypothetical protein
MKPRTTSIAILLAVSLTVIGSMSVIGLLQSTERVSTSGIIVQPPPPPSLPPPSPPPPPPPPEPTIDIDVYSDIDCTEVATNVEWEPIESGKSVSSGIYIKNSGDRGVILSLDTQNWSPSNAADYIQLNWDYDGSTLNPATVLEVTLTLSVSSDITGIENFNFDIVLIGEAS